jgi:hypothetical protein
LVGALNFNAPTNGPQNFNAPTNGPQNFNPATNGPQNFNAPTPAVPGNAANALGITFPGSNAGGTPAPVINNQTASYYSFPDGQSHSVTVAPGGYIDITIE